MKPLVEVGGSFYRYNYEPVKHGRGICDGDYLGVIRVLVKNK